MFFPEFFNIKTKKKAFKEYKKKRSKTHLHHRQDLIWASTS